MNKLLTYDGVAEVLGTSKWYVMKEVKAGKLKPIKLGSNVRFTEEEVERFIEEQQQKNGHDRTSD